MAEKRYVRFALREPATQGQLEAARQALSAVGGVEALDAAPGDRELRVALSPDALLVESLLAARLEAAGVLLANAEPEERPLGFSAPPPTAAAPKRPPMVRSLPVLGQGSPAPRVSAARTASRWLHLPVPELGAKELRALAESLRKIPGVIHVQDEPKLSRLRAKVRAGEVSRAQLVAKLPSVPGPAARALLVAPGLDDPGHADHLVRALRQVPGVERADANPASGLILARGSRDTAALVAAAARAGVRAAPRGEPAPRDTLREGVGAILALAEVGAGLAGLLPGGMAARVGLAGLALVLVGGPALLVPRRADWLRWLGAVGCLVAAFVVPGGASLPEIAAAGALAMFTERALARRQRADTSAPLLGLIQRLSHKARVESQREGNTLLTEREEAKPGEIVVVRAGETIPADGPVIRGRAEVEEDAVLPSGALRAGELAYAGQRIGSGEVAVRVSAVGEETFLGRVILRAEEARAERPRARAIDTSMPMVALGLAAALGLVAFGMLGWEAGLSGFLLGLVALPAGSGRAAEGALSAEFASQVAAQGLLLGELDALRRAGQATDVMLDRSGALLRRETRVGDVISLYDLPEEHIIRYAAAAMVGVPHPVAEALTDYARSTEVSLPEAEMQDPAPGEGALASILGKAVYVGTAKLLEENNVKTDALAEETALLEADGKEVVYVAIDRRLVGLLSIEDAPRRGAKPAVEALNRLGVTTIQVSGSEGGAPKALGGLLGVTETRANLAPHQRAWEIDSLREEGRVVAAVGDAEEDAPLLAAADVSIALSSLGDTARASFESAAKDPGAAVVAIRAGRALLRAQQAARYGSLAYLGALTILAGFGIPGPVVVLLSAGARALPTKLGSF